MSFIDSVRQKLTMVLTLDRPPRTIAVSSGLGVLIGLSPYVGTHTYLAILFSGWFNLPIYPLMIGAYVTNPFTIPFIYGFTTNVGMWILGRSGTLHFDWSDITVHSLLVAGKTLFLPFIIGTHLVGLVFSIFTYFIVYYIVKRYRGEKPENKGSYKKK